MASLHLIFTSKNPQKIEKSKFDFLNFSIFKWQMGIFALLLLPIAFWTIFFTSLNPEEKSSNRLIAYVFLPRG